MVNCLTMGCLFCALAIVIGLISVLQVGAGIYFSSIQPDLIIINALIRTETFIGYPAYILFVFIGLGLGSLLFSFVSIYGTVRRATALSVVLAVLWFFIALVNLVLFVAALLYHFLVLPQLRSLLLRSLQRSPVLISTHLDLLQSKYSCCGFDQSDDYNNLPLDPFPSSCCRVPNCWRDTDINQHTDLNATVSLMHNTGCYSSVEKYLQLEVWMLVGVAGVASLLQLLASLLICSLHRRYKQCDDHPKFVVRHFAPNEGNPSQLGSTQTVEITQI